MDQILKLRKLKQEQQNGQTSTAVDLSDDDEDLFAELNAILGKVTKINSVAILNNSFTLIFYFLVMLFCKDKKSLQGVYK